MTANIPYQVIPTEPIKKAKFTFGIKTLYIVDF